MKILVISYFFAPQNAIGAVRPTKLAKYLERMGHQVTVICGGGMDGMQDPTLARDMAAMRDVHVIQERNWLRWMKQRRGQPATGKAGNQTAPKAADTRQSRVHKAGDAVYRWLRWRADASFRRRAIRECKGLSQTYDVVFSSYAPMSVHRAACRAKRLGVAKRWIADYRDEVTVPFDWMKGKIPRFYQMVKENADICCAVSQGFLEMMGRQQDGRVLSNGYDREDLPERRTVRQPDGTLRVAYCGQVSEGRRHVADRDITPMFRTLQSLAGQGLLHREQIRLVYAGRESGLFRAQAESCGLGGCVEDHGLVSRQESIRLQQGADILLMASWHMSSQKGIMTGKLFEYMMMDKPIICCMAGDLTGSPLARLLDQTGVGLCCEQAAGEGDRQKLRAYLQELLTRWKAGQSLLNAQNRAEEFAYPQLAAKLSGWMEILDQKE